MENQETTIDLKDIAYILKKHLKMLIIVPVVAALVAGIVSFFLLQPVYQSSIDILINQPSSDVSSSANPNDITAYQKLVSTYAEMAKLRTVTNEAGVQLGLSEKDIAELTKTISVNPKGNTQILTVSVQSNNPELATQYVGALVQSLKVTGAEKLGQDNIQLLDTAIVPTSPVAPNKIMNIAIAFVLGAMIAVFVAFLIEYLDTRVKRPEEIEHLLDLPIIGMIPDFNKEGDKK